MILGGLAMLIRITIQPVTSMQRLPRLQQAIGAGPTGMMVWIFNLRTFRRDPLITMSLVLKMGSGFNIRLPLLMPGGILFPLPFLRLTPGACSPCYVMTNHLQITFQSIIPVALLIGRL